MHHRLVQSLAVTAGIVATAAVCLLLLGHPKLTHHLGTAAVLAAAAVAWAFVFGYARRSWRQWDEGIHLMRFTIGIALICSYSALINVIGPVAIREPLTELARLVIFTFVAVMMVDRYRLLQRAIKRDREARDAEEPLASRVDLEA